MHQQQTTFENFVGKGEIAHNEQFLLFPQCFLLNQITVSPFVRIFDIVSLFASELEEPRSGIMGKVLKTFSAKEERLITSFFLLFSSPEHIVLRVSYCDRSLSGVRPSVRP